MQTCPVGPRVLLLAAALLAAVGPGPRPAEGQRSPVRIGALSNSWGPTPAEVGLRDGLIALGYRENRDFVLGSRFTQGNPAALPAAARDLVDFGADLIFATGEGSALAARAATERLPIVFATVVGDPVGQGLIQSFARPGGNVTGVTDLDLELGPKRLELLRELVPGLRRVLIVYDPAEAYMVTAVAGYRRAARQLGIELREEPVRSVAEGRSVLAGLGPGDVHGILAPSNLTHDIPGGMLEEAVRHRIPTMFSATFWVERGGLVSYGPDYYQSGLQAARLVDKILKGADPAEVPVEANHKIELAINAKTAEALGLTIPPALLLRADRVIR